MNKLVPIGFGAAAAVVALVVGAQLLAPPAPIGPSGPGGAPSVAPSATTEPSVASPSSPADGSLPEGPFVVTRLADDALTITVTIPTSGWTSAPEFDAIAKGEDADPPEASILFWSWPAGTPFYVYGDPCHWESTIPDTPAITVEGIVSALAAQASRDASDPVDVTVGGHAGKHITLHVPDNAVFADCEGGEFVSYGVPGDDLARYHQGPGQVDELWILDVDGAIVIIDAMYRPNTPGEFIEEMRAIAESATFE